MLLTQLGGGAFGNEPGWILDAIWRALTLFSERDLEVNIVSYGMPHPSLLQQEKKFAAEAR